MDAEVGSVNGDESITNIVQCWFAADLQMLFGKHDTHCVSVLEFADRMGAGSVFAKAPRRLLGDLCLGYEPALGRITTGELDTG
jgi:hypothetical protein